MKNALFDYDINEMLFCIKPEDHNPKAIEQILRSHPEVKFVSLVGIDIGGLDTDEKIPTDAFIEDMEKFFRDGVQTDGSSVVLPVIATLNDAKVDIIPDLSVNWYVDYNLKHIDRDTRLPVGTLRIPSFLKHNDVLDVGARVVLRDAINTFKNELLLTIKENPYVLENMDLDSADDIEEILLTSATELEFWVKTPEEDAMGDELSTAQVLKEQYWKRTIGPVRTALEKSIMFLDKFGFEVEMGHKEVGGARAKLGSAGHYEHVMEQLEIDWKYAEAMQAADNEMQVKYLIRDVFRLYGLDVIFSAKPIPGVAGNGEHTHLGVAARLKNGKVINLFNPKDMTEDFLNPIGFGALMGLLHNYEVVNPFISGTNDAFDRLKPGFEAPVCVVTSLGHSPELASRNRTILVGLVRELKNPLGTRFELRAPNPRSNTYLVIASAYMAMLDGIKAALSNQKTSKELEVSISKKRGEEDFYLDTSRQYRSEEDVFEAYNDQERNDFFGKTPITVWENLKGLETHKEKLKIYETGGVKDEKIIESYKEAVVQQWAMELQKRIVPNTMDLVRRAKKSHTPETGNSYDDIQWEKIAKIREYLGRDTIDSKCLLTRISIAIEESDYDTASDLQIEMQKEVHNLRHLYTTYKKNLF